MEHQGRHHGPRRRSTSPCIWVLNYFQIIIDHASDVGFSQVAAAREYLLAKGRRPVSSENTPNQGVGSSPEIFTRGSHVVAPVRIPGAFGVLCA